ncbi:hypothetical protein [Sphaerisporangium rhizosphaerae]|uniref:Uncharacterized protein n=1 Tax=Sphaerisporangium rhizosphaerae TaxID=2269375 RepID=A0ABW2PKE9_9ACTN
MTDDDHLLAALRLAAGADPVPAHVITDAQAVHALRLPDAVIADLVPLHDSPPGPEAEDSPPHRDVSPVEVHRLLDGRPPGSPGEGRSAPRFGRPLGAASFSGTRPPPSGTRPPVSGVRPPFARAKPPAGVRSDGHASEGEPRLLRFAAEELTIDVEITVCDSHLDLAGQVLPAPGEGARVEIRTPHVSKMRLPTETGEFATTGLPHGWVSVVYHRTGAPPVATRWQCVRP